MCVATGERGHCEKIEPPTSEVDVPKIYVYFSNQWKSNQNITRMNTKRITVLSLDIILKNCNLRYINNLQ